MKILVVGSKYNQPGEEQNLKNYSRFFQQAAGERAKVHYALLDDLLYDIAPDNFRIFDLRNGVELSDYKLIVLRGKLRDELDQVYVISHYASIHKINFFNDYRQSRSISKLAQAVNFYTLGLPFPRTIHTNEAYLKEMIKRGDLGLPFIYKHGMGAHGSNNHLIRSVKELEGIKQKGMIAQPFIPNDCDYRIIIVGDKYLVIKRKAQADSHLNNTSVGGTAELVKNLDKGIIRESKEIARYAQMSCSGVDVIIDKKSGKHYFLEINSQPQIMSGAFIDEKKKLVSDFVSKLLDQ